MATVEVNKHLTKDTALSVFRTMQIIRQCEEQLAKSHQRGLVHGACHTYVGEEAIASSIFAHLRPEDVVFSTHRGHGHALAKGLHPRELIAELYGRKTGCSQGRGGSMHLFKPEIGMMGTSGIVGPCILHACGGGYTFKIQKKDIKDKLHEHTNDAIKEGVFGVPTLIVEGELFWGLDSTDFLKYFLTENKKIKEKILNPVNSFRVGKAKRKIQ